MGELLVAGSTLELYDLCGNSLHLCNNGKKKDDDVMSMVRREYCISCPYLHMESCCRHDSLSRRWGLLKVVEGTKSSPNNLSNHDLAVSVHECRNIIKNIC